MIFQIKIINFVNAASKRLKLVALSTKYFKFVAEIKNKISLNTIILLIQI